jgi:hypothetical protein
LNIVGIEKERKRRKQVDEAKPVPKYLRSLVRGKQLDVYDHLISHPFLVIVSINVFALLSLSLLNYLISLFLPIQIHGKSVHCGP